MHKGRKLLPINLLLTLTDLCAIKSDFIIFFMTLTLRSLARPATIGGACDVQTSGVDGVSIVSTLCSDSH